MRILMVSPYPPIRDGIANYAVQEVRRLRAEGHDVEVLSPGPSAAHHHLDLRGPRGTLALAKRVTAYDRVIIQFHPDVFYPHPSTDPERAAVTAGLIAVCRRAGNVEVRVHELDYELGRRASMHGALSRVLWRSVDRLSVHTEAERDNLVRAFGLRPDQVALQPHGDHFDRRTHLDQAEARERLGLAAEDFVFLSIGFLQPHKGFDRAIDAFERIGLPGTRLDVVGSLRVESPDFVAHADDLARRVRQVSGAHLHEGYVSDERFDTWLVASDVVVLPYRHIWSSGVMERAQLYGRPVIASRVGGLEQQAPPGTVLVDDDAELAGAMAQAAGQRLDALAPAVERAPWPAPADRAAVMAEIRDRAAVGGGGHGRPARPDGRVDRPDRAASARLRRVPPLAAPSPASASGRAAAVKKLVWRLTGWELGPVIHQINKLHEALIDTVEAEAAAKAPGGAERTTQVTPGAVEGLGDAGACQPD